jgi:hypothetical protein
LEIQGRSGVMSLIEQVVESAGGQNRWRRFERFTVHLSINGGLLESKGKGRLVRDVVVEGSTREPSLCVTGFTAPNRRALFRPDRVAIERADGVLLAERVNPRAAFAGHTDETPWDDLDLAYYCGCIIWPCLVLPFELAEPDIEVVELAPEGKNGLGQRRLKIELPAGFPGLADEQVIHFDRGTLPCRVEHSATFATGRRLVEELSAHQEFSGIILSTLRQGWFAGEGRTAPTRHAAVEVEIFDAVFA